MNITDPIADMLTRIRNGLIAKKEEVKVPASKIKTSIVLSIIIKIASIMIVIARLINVTFILDFPMLTSLSPCNVLIPVSNSTASVVVFTPPPVDDGEAPINIKTKVNIYETGVSAA